VAERGGFEPPVPFDKYDGLANRWFQPLTHLSFDVMMPNFFSYYEIQICNLFLNVILEALRFLNVRANISCFNTFAKKNQKKSGIKRSLLIKY
jgi:hypothetical protein